MAQPAESSTLASPADVSLWHVQRRPGRGFTLVIAAVALALIVGSSIFGAMIHLERQPWFGLGVGILMAALFVAGLLRGSEASIDSDRMLTVSMGGKANLRLPLSAIVDGTMVRAGLLQGVGLRIDDYSSIHFLHKSGINFPSMRRNRQRLGVDMVLEHLQPDDLARIMVERDVATNEVS